jgi:endonuclease YncB( thermonuclease family)
MDKSIVDKDLLDSNSKTPRFKITGNFVAKCVAIHDGDTGQFTFRPFPSSNVMRFTCRLLKYNSAEVNSADTNEKLRGLECKKALSDLILNKIVLLEIPGDSEDPYGRPLVICHLDPTLSSQSVNDIMITNGYGKPYTGHGDKLWKGLTF